jgi:hypothetical protein
MAANLRGQPPESGIFIRTTITMMSKKKLNEVFLRYQHIYTVTSQILTQGIKSISTGKSKT